MGIFRKLLLAGMIGLGATYVAAERFPQLQRYKNAVLPFTILDETKEVPNTMKETSELKPLVKVKHANHREKLEEKIAQLFITRMDNFKEYFPGGILLGKEETETGNFFGRYTSYDPEKTQETIEEFLEKAEAANKRVLIFEEGEGGYVAGIGVLPAAKDIGKYFTDNIIGPTIKERVSPSQNKDVRSAEVEKLFGEYARELRDRGIDVVFGPVLDAVFQEDAQNVLALQDRQFSDQHLEIRKIAQLYLKMMKLQGIKTVGKHFLSVGLAEEGDIHEERVVNPGKISPRRWAGKTYSLFKNDLQGIMLSHTGNPSDFGRPYSVSQRAYEYLTQESYPVSQQATEDIFTENNQEKRRYQGINYQGLTIIDDLSMRGLLDYVQTAPLTNRGKMLTAQASTIEAKAAILAFAQGAESIISLHADLDEIVRNVAQAYHADRNFAQQLERAMKKYAAFAE
ncbi:hypothetical protein HYX13_00585 [Candidatus Woesearchaeota archaeon]|nr:hypothetical protein [Candidatus Woesearchaeota archaeon]